MRRIQRNVAVVAVLAVLGTGVPAAHAQEALTLDGPVAATLSAPAPVADVSRAVGGTTSVSLGEGGTTVFTRDTVDQRAVYAQALNGVIAWRKDALADADIKLPYNGTYLTVPEYLQEIGMPESEYLSPQWSNALELIALQRAIEAYDYDLGHTRPNGDSCWTAQYNGIGSWGEILAWGPPTMRGAIDLWASEKADYLKELNNEPHGATGHYVALITPENRYYGFAGASGMRYGTTWSGEMASTLQGSQTATNLKGTYEFSVNVSVDKLAQGVSVELPSQLKMGQRAQAKAKLAYMGGRYELRGGWTSSNPAVLSVDANGTVTAHNEGTARITISAQGQSFSASVQVSAVSLAFNANGGSGSTQAVKGAVGAKVTVPVNTFSRTGHTFTGWNTKANGTGTAYKPGAQYTLGSSDATLYAQWKLNTYTVQFDGNGASTSVAPVQVQHGKTIAQPDTPMNIGRAFAGWYTARTGGSRFDFKTPVTGNMTLYARWNRMVFADVRQEGQKDPTPHATDIQWLADNGISGGWLEANGTYTFRGMDTVKRQDMAAFLRREAVRRGVGDAATWKPSTADWERFKDVNSKTPHAEDILWLAHAGISTGWKEANGSYTFRGMDTVKRQDMAAFLKRLADKAGKANGVKPKTDFTDVSDRTPHAAEVRWLGGSGISTGYRNADGTWRFEGMTSVYRQDMAAFLHRLDNQLGK
ncbi:internalin [Bifidobacterium pseudolongum subsp. globosum]|uniref:Internalin n=1 Tax=Bifidobacterium pseudolongum subsp. globosum TaxID=1690 RepID=A0A2N3QGU4_9BIFI|nr:InlB B-repeat-containing protein [Bifidobacterium pseudolongum]PKU90478.1 internalin [Bifidobacterium pseudolongum subsp. globosum]